MTAFIIEIEFNRRGDVTAQDFTTTAIPEVGQEIRVFESDRELFYRVTEVKWEIRPASDALLPVLIAQNYDA